MAALLIKIASNQSVTTKFIMFAFDLQDMKVIADLHIHGRFSRATSKALDIASLEKWARIKGVSLLGTGDFTHPEWIRELKANLAEDGSGILKTRSGFPFMLQTEICLMYSQGGKGRRVHNIVLAPSFEVVAQITDYLGKNGRLDYDGRPIFKIPCPNFVEMLKNIDDRIEIIPAHCLPPNARVHTNSNFKSISAIREGEKVLTHKGKFQKVLKVHKRSHKGDIYKIVPWYFREGTAVTPEHPFYAIKSFSCNWIKGLCKPLCSQKNNCNKKRYLDYSPSWIPASELEVGDFLVYPRLRETRDIEEIKISDYVRLSQNGKYVDCGGTRGIKVQNQIKVDESFCKLAGYYIAEGYTNGRDAVSFCFRTNEEEYISDVELLMLEKFGFLPAKHRIKEGGVELIYYSKTLYSLFHKLFYDGKGSRASNKSLPDWMLMLTDKKKGELLRGWWHGDAGYTVSQKLADQMKTICLSLGIIPSLSVDRADEYKKRGKHFIGKREISTNKDLFVFSNLSFFGKACELLSDNCFKKFRNKRHSKHGWVDDRYAYLPIRKIKIDRYEGEVFNLEVENDNSYVTEFATVHNCWTPWFSMFGSMSGFDSIKECFQDQAKHIHAIETGLSSDPAMNWRLSQLDNVAIVSFSDCHSFWPWRLGREATVFELKNLSYTALMNSLRTKEGLAETIEFFPEEGKYHYDGHRACNVVMSPQESIKVNDICPVCKKRMTIGVAHRVEELADKDRPLGFKPRGAVPFRSLIPLSEVIAGVSGSPVASRKVWAVYNRLIERFGNELSVLMDAPEGEIAKITEPNIARMIVADRTQKIQFKPGYDGEYGHPLFDGKEVDLHKFDFGSGEKEKFAAPSGNSDRSQKSLVDF